MTSAVTDTTDGPDDSLELLLEQDRVLIEIFRGWYDATPPVDADSRTVVKEAYRRGTFGKLLIEHAAVRVAAKEDVARVLRVTGDEGRAARLTARLGDVRRILDRLDELARGVEAMGLAASQPFAAAVGELAALVRADLSIESDRLIPDIGAALGGHRSELHSARWVHHHAPTHPSPDPRWYDTVPALVRIHARYDRMRGFPWAENSPMEDPTKTAEVDGPR